MRFAIVAYILAALPVFAFGQSELGDVNTHPYDLRPKGTFVAGSVFFSIEQTADPQKCILSLVARGHSDTVVAKFDGIVWGHLFLILGTNTMILWKDEDHGVIMSPKAGPLAVRRDVPLDDLLRPDLGTLDSQPWPGVASNAQALSGAVWGVSL